jgi:hypothetical protein
MRTIVFLIVVFGHVTLHADDTPLRNQKPKYTTISIGGLYENRLYFHSFGVISDISKGWHIWSTRHTTGYFELGGSATYSHEYNPQFESSYEFEKTDCSSHHVQCLFKIGSTMHLPPKEHLIFGMYVFGGVSYIARRGYLSNEKYGVKGDYAAQKGIFTSGLMCDVGYRINDRLSIVSKELFTLPNRMLEIAPLFSTSLGCVFQLR